MSKRNGWRIGFLAVTALAIVMELVAAFDSSPETDPWTDLIVAYIPGEVAAVAFGALACWLPVHFYIRYRRRARTQQDQAGEP